MSLLMPHENYLKVLLAARESVDKIKSKMFKLNLMVEESSLLKLRQKLVLEQPKYFDFKEDIDIDWLEKHSIDRMFGYLYDKQVRRPLDGAPGAVKLVDDQHVYKMVTSMALAGIEDTEIELRIGGSIDINYTLDDIREFLNIFFNVQDWPFRDKEAYVFAVKGNRDLKRAYKEALKGDINKLLHTLKLSPKLDLDEMIRDMTHDVYYKFKGTVDIDPDLAIKFGVLVDKLAGRLDKIQQSDRETEEAHRGLEMVFEDATQDDIISVVELKKDGGEE